MKGTPPTTGTWNPLLEGDLAERAWMALEGIAQDMPTGLGNPSLAGGDAGAAIFYAYLDKVQPGRGFHTRGLAHLDHAMTALGEGVMGSGLYSGFTGVAWAMDHLQGRLFPPPQEDPNGEIDHALETVLARTPWRDDYDLISGLAGYALYALDRPVDSGRPLLDLVAARLDETKVLAESGCTWHTPPELLPQWQRELHPKGYFNLGLAHGVPALVAILGQMEAAGAFATDTRELLGDAVAWLLAQEYPEGVGSRFGTVVTVGGGGEAYPSRIAWCYGDLGLAIALLGAARSVRRDDWEAEALRILRLAARREVGKAGAVDAGLCHGAAGNAHIFNRLWQATGEDVFRRAAVTWFEETMAYRVPGKGVGGFRAKRPGKMNEENPHPWEDVAGFLEGSLGVGLALISGLTTVLPEWDRSLLVFLPPRH